MYERSAIVLERYMEEILKLNKRYNLKKNNENYKNLIEEIENYQNMTNQGIAVMQEFDDTAEQIENLQQRQEKLYRENKELEETRTQLFKDLGEDARTLEHKLTKIEKELEENNSDLKEIREDFIECLSDFSKKQKERNKCEKERRIGEAKHIEYIQRTNEEFSQIEVKDITNLKDFISSEKELVRQEALNIMTKNGKNERIAFNQDVLKKAINTRIDIAEKEAECYILIFDRMRKILAEKDTETIKLQKYKKALRDTSVKLAFLKAQKEYIVGFLDYERMTAISGPRAHKKMMIEACNNFELDMMQIKNLYELILKEISNKSTQKAYKELYNKTYLRNIEDKEKNFEEEVNNVNISMGTVINSNYWRIEGIKNIYMVFQEEVSQKFEKDLTEYRIEEQEEIFDDEYEEDEEDLYQDDEYDNYEDYEDDIDDKAEDNKDESEDDDQKKDSDNYEENIYKYKFEEDSDNYESNIYQYRYEEKNDKEEKVEQEEFDVEESLEEIIQKSRKKENKGGLFNKLFKNRD